MAQAVEHFHFKSIYLHHISVSEFQRHKNTGIVLSEIIIIIFLSKQTGVPSVHVSIEEQVTCIAYTVSQYSTYYLQTRYK